MSKSGLLPIEKKVFQRLEEYFVNVGELRVVLGVSGGIDSMCLLHVFKKLHIKTTAVHINYGMRGEESQKDADFVARICNEWDVPCVIHETDPANAEGSNFQTWARRVRYRIFREEAQKMEADAISIAHNRDDQIETILQKIFRGGGLASWSAMQMWNGRLLRPLLDVPRNEIEKYCAEKSIEYRLDKSNLKSAYARNFLRNEWLPQLEQHFPGWPENVLRAADQAEIFTSALDYILKNISDEANRLHRKMLLELPLPLQKSLLLRTVQKKAPDVSISADALSQLDRLGNLQTGKSLQLTDALNLTRDRSHFQFTFGRPDLPKHRLLHREELKNNPVSHEGFEFRLKLFNQPDFTDTLYLDAQKLAWPLQIRAWENGDRIQPLGMNGRQLVADHLTNRKVNTAEKPKALVVQTFDDTIAAVIFPAPEKHDRPGTIAELFKCDHSTKQCLTMRPTT